MTAPTNRPEAPLERLSALAARDFADPAEAIAAILDLARDLLGLTTAVVTRTDGDTWRAVHVADAAFGLAPGATLPLSDTFCGLVGADAPVVITDARNDPRGDPVTAPARLGVRTFLGVPLVLRDGALYGTLCVLDARASDLGGDAVATLRILARLVVHELEHERRLAAVRDEEEQRFRALVRHASDVVAVLAADGAVRYVSPSVARLLGYTPDALVGTNASALADPADIPRLATALTGLTTAPDEHVVIETRARHRDGTWRDVELTAANLLADPGVGGIVVNACDITERKRAEERLREAEARYRTLVESLPAIVYIKRVTGDDLTTTYVSPQVEAILGYSPDRYLRDRAEWAERLHPDDRERALGEDLRTDATGEPFRAEYRARARDGRWVWLRDEAVLVRGEDGRPAYWLGVQFDVTERQAAAAALQRSEARFRALIQNGSDIVSVLAADGTIGYQSPAVLPVLGYTPEELEGQNVFAFVHPEDAPRAAAALAGCVADPDGRALVEHRFRHKDGSWRDLEAIGANLLADPAVGGVVVNCRDVTERQAAEAALRESEANSRELAAAAQRQARELALLGEVRTALARELELAPLFRTVVDAVAEAFGYAMVSLYLLEEEVLVLQHQVGYERVIERVPIAAGVMGRVVRTGRPELVADGPADPDFLLAVEGITSEVCVPLLDQGRVGGALILESRGGVVLAEDDLRLMLALAEHVGVAIGRARLYAEVRAREARFGALVRNAPDLITILAVDGTVVYESPANERVLGYAPDELVGENALALVHPDDQPRVGDFLARALARPGVTLAVEFRFPHKDGSWRDLEAVGTNLLADPAVGGIVVNSRDATARKRAEERLSHLAYHDPLTGLPNRARFLERLDGALARARRGAGPVAVLLLDLDGFKLVNDSRGHHAGDELLAEVGRRLRGALRPGDTLSRLGGDEFAALLEGVADAGEGARAAERLIGALRPPVVLDGEEAYVGASVGVAASTRRRSQAGDLLRSADIALYRAKAAGRGTFAVFEPRMQAPVAERLERETALRRGLERDELELHYQPKVELATGRIVGAEALVRWTHPEHGLLPPGDFIPAAEETGLIVPLGRWVLREACRRAAGWKGRRLDAPPRVCVNLTVRQLREADFATEVARALEEGGLDPGCLELEITETAAMADAPETRRALRALRKLGVRLAIDDFGTGYSSLSGLRDLAVDALKVDGSFVAGLDGDGTSLAIVRAVAVLAHDLGLAVTAEGVETAVQAARLRDLGVDLGQGFRFAPPLAAEAFDDLLARGSRLPEDMDVPDVGNAGMTRGRPGAHDAEHAGGAGRGAGPKLAVPAGR